MLKRLVLAAALLASAGAAQAAHTVSFTPGAASPAPGYRLVYDFDTTKPSSLTTGPLVQIKTPPADANGAPPANSSPSGTAYLSVLGGGSAQINFASTVTGFSLDWGSIDLYNTLTLFGTDGMQTVIAGTDFISPANGNQTAAGTNGLFTVMASAGTRLTGFRLDSSTNSFEIDNVAVAGIPEPTTWAMMILGVGAIGGSLRRRQRVSARIAHA